MNSTIRLITITTVLLVPFFVAAASPAVTLPPPTPGAGVTLKDFIDLLIKIIQSVGIPALVVYIIYSGYLLVTAGDNEAQITKAKVGILSCLIGAAIILGAQSIADMVFGTAALF